jgi:glycosyltransferase involved in cell wall biosynthesis
MPANSADSAASVPLPSSTAIAPSVRIPLPAVPGKSKPDQRPATISVLHVVNGEYFSGAERVQSHLGRCLPGFGVTADFASLKPGKFADMVAEKQGQWGRGYFTPMKHRFDLQVAKSICKIIDDERHDLLHAHTPRSGMIAAIASRLRGIPWVYHVHSPAARDSAKALSNRLNAWIEKLSLRTCSRLITVSGSLRQDCIASGISAEKISVVHNGVPSIRPARTATPSPGGRWVMGMIALQRPRKGLEFALDAIAKVRADGHDVVLRIIGPYESEAYRQSIEDQIDRLTLHDAIEQIGFTEDVSAELAKLDAMLLPSLFGEGLPMVVLEAMAAAVPVIATRVEGTPEAVTHGVEGLLAQPRDAESLAQAISELVTGKYDWTEMSEAAFATHAKKFSDTAMAGGIAEVYRRVLS